MNARDHKRHPEWADTIYTFDFRRNSLEEIFLHDTDWFTNQQPKPLKLINDHGVNLDAPDAISQLAAKGVDKSEINEIMTYHFRRQGKINRLKNLKEAAADRKKINAVYETTVFDTKKLGWVNCDRFYDDPEAYASRKIIIADGLNVALTLNYIKTNTLKDSLQAVLSN